LFGNGTNLTYAPKPGMFGGDSFTYKFWDGQRFGNAARVSIQVSAAGENRPPEFVSIVRENGLVELVLKVSPGKGMSLQSSGDLLNWAPLGERVVPLGETHTFQDTNATGAVRFYRAVRE
jgi:hypothetical protein